MRKQGRWGLLLAAVLAVMCVFPAAAQSPFTDVSEESWAYDGIVFVRENGLMTGVSKTEFGPTIDMTMEMLLSVLHRIDGGAAEVTAQALSDWAAQLGLLPEGVTDLSAAAKREEMVYLLYRYGGSAPASAQALARFPDVGEVSAYALEAMRWAVGTGLMQGVLHADGSITLSPKGTLTRQQCAVLLSHYAQIVGLKGQELTGTQNVVVEGFDWGPAVTKTILSLSAPVKPESVSAEKFTVTERKESFNWAALAVTDGSVDPSKHITVSAPRTVTAAYVCDEKGVKREEAGAYVALELAYDPNTGSPYCYDVLTWHNTVCDPYELDAALAPGAALQTAQGARVNALTVAPQVDLSQAAMPQLEGVDVSGSFTGSDGKTLRYGSYEPAPDGYKHPLVIWVHGAGEGGLDATIPILGNKVTALYEDAFQSVMGGAYVLTPQTPDFWLRYSEDTDDWADNPGKPSIYTQTLKELIDAYVKNHPDVDTDRIVIGGCSNGGYMTMNMVLTYPDFFAAAFPICEAYLDAGITDAQLQSIKDLPVWFVYAQNDTTVDPKTFEEPTVRRLEALGGDVHTSVFPNVVDTSGAYTGEDGAPYEYMGHWSWLYFFNNECTDGELNLWNWLAAADKDTRLVRETAQGSVQGIKKGGSFAWYGVPYAKAPVGELRWAAPEAPESWSGVRPCIASAEIGIQAAMNYTTFQTEIKGTEDCLNLDIFAAPDAQKRPVLVYIHGGNNQTSFSAEIEGSQAAVKDDCVYVSLNYRLGLLGFNCLPAIAGEGETGNFTLLDIAAALDWVKENIAAFGGDPENITVSGFSAGGRDVMAMLISPLFKDKFQKAVVYSGGMTVADPEVSAVQIAAALAPLAVEDGKAADETKAAEWLLTDDPAVKDYLLSVRAERIAPLMSNAGIRMSVFPHLFSDGVALPEEGFATEDYNEVPVLMLTGETEFSLFSAYDGYFYSLDPALQDSAKAFAIRYGSDMYRIFNAQCSAETMYEHYGKNIYLCQVRYGSAQSKTQIPLMGSFHGIFVPMLTKQHTYGGFADFSTAGYQDMAEIFNAYLKNFLATGDPNGTGLARWTPWTPEKPESMLMDADGTKASAAMADVTDDYESIMDALDADTSVSEQVKGAIISNILNGRWFSAALDARYQNPSLWVADTK